MGSYLADDRVTVFPFTHAPDGEESVIANVSKSVFLSLPSSAVDIMTWLSQKRTVGEAQALYAQKYGEVPDMEDFLELLESEGFVASEAEAVQDADALPLSVAAPEEGARALPGTDKRYHFESISQQAARRIFSRPVLLLCLLLIGAGLVLVILDPAVVPPPSILVFKQNLTLMSIGLYVFIFATVFLHELAHLVAARAAGAPAQLGISHRLWVLVAQTDMTGIWLAPRRQRYLAVLAGSLLDAGVAAVLIVLIFAQHRGWLAMPPLLLLCCQVALFTYLIRLLWQCYLFVRTDFYYVLVILFQCKDLMGDTEVFLQNQCARMLPFIKRVDQSHIPTNEMRVIRAFSVVWVAGRIVAFASLFFISIPILVGYYLEIGTFLIRGHVPGSLAVADVAGWVILIAVPLILQTAGLVLWIRSLYFARRVKRNGRLAS